MFDKLEDLLIRYEELMSELSEPDVANNQERFRKLKRTERYFTDRGGLQRIQTVQAEHRGFACHVGGRI